MVEFTSVKFHPPVVVNFKLIYGQQLRFKTKKKKLWLLLILKYFFKLYTLPAKVLKILFF